jgi:hypothetical protein
MLRKYKKIAGRSQQELYKENALGRGLTERIKCTQDGAGAFPFPRALFKAFSSLTCFLLACTITHHTPTYIYVHFPYTHFNPEDGGSTIL